MSFVIGSFGNFKFDKPIPETLREKLDKFHLADWYRWNNKPVPDTVQINFESIKSEMPKDVTVSIPTSWCPWAVTSTEITTWCPGEIEEMRNNYDFILWLIFFMQVYLIPKGIRISGHGSWVLPSDKGGVFGISHDYIIGGKLLDHDIPIVSAHNLYARECIKREKRKMSDLKSAKDPKRYFVNPVTCKCKEIPREEVDGFINVRKSVYDRLRCSASAVKEVDSFIATCGIEKVYTQWTKYGPPIKEHVCVQNYYGKKEYVSSCRREIEESKREVFFYRFGWRSLKVSKGKLEIVLNRELDSYDVSHDQEMELVKCRWLLLQQLIPKFYVDTDELYEEFAGFRFYEGHQVGDCYGVRYCPDPYQLPHFKELSVRLGFEVCNPVAALKEISFDEYVNELYKRDREQ